MNKKVRTGLIVACVILITVVMVAVINSKGKKSSAMVGGGGKVLRLSLIPIYQQPKQRRLASTGVWL
ncbi:MAG: hypothetical protein K2M50_07240, partial [Treponemataceae bacterium]|nr:hypothetical protein [Treponemataceae bacterium]